MDCTRSVLAIQTMFRHVFIAILLVVVVCTAALAEEQSWPDRVTIAGFEIVGVRGTSNADGSGTASGVLRIPGASGQQASLARSRSGGISVACEINTRMGGGELHGRGLLNSSGLRFTGSVEVGGRSVNGAAMTADSEGRFQGSGRMQLGSLGVPVSVTISSSAFSVSGATQSEAECDTALASYRFRGQLSVGSSGGRLTAAASGSVTRKGKFSDQVSTHSISGVSVNVTDGYGSADIGGVSVKFKFF